MNIPPIWVCPEHGQLSDDDVVMIDTRYGEPRYECPKCGVAVEELIVDEPTVIIGDLMDTVDPKNVKLTDSGVRLDCLKEAWFMKKPSSEWLPVIVDKDWVVLDGQQRVLAALKHNLISIPFICEDDDKVVMFMKELIGFYSSDPIAAGLQMSWLEEKKLFYVAVHRFPTHSISSRKVVAKATEPTFYATLAKCQEVWNRIKMNPEG